MTSKDRFFHFLVDGRVKELSPGEYRRLTFNDATHVKKKTFVVLTGSEIGLSRDNDSIWVRKSQIMEILNK